MRRMKHLGATLALGALVTPGLLGLTATAAQAAVYANGFETNTDGWTDWSGGTITRVPTGSNSLYADGVAAATGNYYARLGKDPDPSTCTYGGGTANIHRGPYTEWGGVSSTFPAGGYSTTVDVYLDVAYATSHPDTRFDWSSVISDPSGNYRRGFMFNVGTDASGFVITGGNNSSRCDSNPYSTDPNHAPRATVTNSGWYTLKHTFSNQSGVLSVTMELIRKSNGDVIGSWTRSDPTDIIGTTVGGNNIGWFDQNEFDGLAIDNSRMGAYMFQGFRAPINSNDVNVAVAGQTIPVKWRLLDGATPVSDPSSFDSLTSVKVNCASLEEEGTDAIETYTNTSGLIYQNDGYWQFSWKTPKAYAGQCRIMTLTLSDGNAYTAEFKFK
jgi:hypothetical protein